MFKRLSALLCILTLVLAVALLESCRTDPQVSDGPEVSASGPVKAAVRLRGEPDRLNPFLSSRGFSRYVYRHIFPTLVEFDPNTMELVPMLAKALPVAESITEGEYAGGIAYTMEIHEEAGMGRWQPGPGFRLYLYYENGQQSEDHRGDGHLPGCAELYP